MTANEVIQLQFELLFSSEEQHLASLSDDEGPSFDDDDNSSDSDSNVEVTSTIDESENELVRLSTYLQLESQFDNDDDQNF
ncbi:unnamed protein product [Rotaria sordida]|uniref:Uncharacterized protein n=1 Tax=Rotaria sordida TaxID=392033 RepID=A0A816DJZ1_9BILA|nr:unnamed protein product [Rotaria sordida]CAF1638199.1 unnamed protein product [Rotaria sordida]